MPVAAEQVLETLKSFKVGALVRTHYVRYLKEHKQQQIDQYQAHKELEARKAKEIQTLQKTIYALRKCFAQNDEGRYVKVVDVLERQIELMQEQKTQFESAVLRVADESRKDGAKHEETQTQVANLSESMATLRAIQTRLQVDLRIKTEEVTNLLQRVSQLSKQLHSARTNLIESKAQVD